MGKHSNETFLEEPLKPKILCPEEPILTDIRIVTIFEETNVRLRMLKIRNQNDLAFDPVNFSSDLSKNI